MEKTLGQIHIDAYEAGPTGEKGAHAIAAVARHVVAEAIAAHVAECHAKPVESAEVAKWKTTDGGKLVQDQPKANDWAMDAANWAVTLYETTGIVTAREIAGRIRDAAERHYGQQLYNVNQMLRTAIKERDAANQRAEAAESALAELKEAMEWITCSGCSPSKGKDGRWRSMFLLDDGIEAATLADAILAAYRNTKAASGAAKGVVKS